MSAGRKLADQLDQTDTLGRWMSFYVLERIDAAARLPDGEQKTTAEGEVADLVLAFWKHRAGAPYQHVPFSEYDIVLETLAEMKATAPRAGLPFIGMRTRGFGGPAEGSAPHLMELLEQLDYTTGQTRLRLLAQATATATAGTINGAFEGVAESLSQLDSASAAITEYRDLISTFGYGHSDDNSDASTQEDPYPEVEALSRLAHEIRTALSAVPEDQ